MKYLLLLLISFNVYAEHRCVVTKDSKELTAPIKENKAACDAWFADNQKALRRRPNQSSFGQLAHWSQEDKGGYDSTREVEYEDINGDPQIRTEYHYPQDYSTDSFDITNELQAAATAKLNKINGLKGRLKGLGLSDEDIELLVK